MPAFKICLARPWTIGLGTGAIALALLIPAWIVLLGGHQLTDAPGHIVLALCLVAALGAGNQFPIHLHESGKVYMGSAILFLMAALLPPALAGSAAALGLAIGECSIRHRTSNPVHAIFTQTARWTAIVLIGSSIAHYTAGGTTLPVLSALTLVAAGAMLAADALTFPLLYCPATGVAPLRAVLLAIREGGVAEGAQYLVGLLGAFETGHGYWTLLLLLLPAALVYTAFKHTKEMHDETRHVLENMADAVDLRDPYTGGHSRRVTELVAATLQELRKSGPEVQLIVSAARVHDIGKIGMPDDVLKKEGSLTDEEWAVMKMHPEQGANLLTRYPDFKHGASIIRHHHERWDGHGYPHRLSAVNIPFGARVIAVADSFDAMTSDRPYRRGMTATRAASILREGRGIQWDPQIVDAFLRTIASRLNEEAAVPRRRLEVVWSADSGRAAQA